MEYSSRTLTCNFSKRINTELLECIGFKHMRIPCIPFLGHCVWWFHIQCRRNVSVKWGWKSTERRMTRDGVTVIYHRRFKQAFHNLGQKCPLLLKKRIAMRSASLEFLPNFPAFIEYGFNSGWYIRGKRRSSEKCQDSVSDFPTLFSRVFMVMDSTT